MNIFISILQHPNGTNKVIAKMSVHLLKETGFGKKASNLAHEAVQALQARVREHLQYAAEALYYAKEYKDIAEEEKCNGPQGERGNYICPNYQHAVSTYEFAVQEWNAFVEEYKDVKHLLPKNHLERI